MNNILMENIKYLREENNWTQRELADRANLSAGAISMIECGKREPNIVTLKAIALALRVSIDYLVGMEEGLIPVIKVPQKNNSILNSLSAKEEQIIVMYRKLSDGMKRNFYEMLSSISGISTKKENYS